MNSTNRWEVNLKYGFVWEICKFWILQTAFCYHLIHHLFERYVNFEFYKQQQQAQAQVQEFERYVNFEFYKQRDENYDKLFSLRDM